MPPPNPRAGESERLPSLSQPMLPHQSFHMSPSWKPIPGLRTSARAPGSQGRDQETGLRDPHRSEKEPRGKAEEPAGHRDKTEVTGLETEEGNRARGTIQIEGERRRDRGIKTDEGGR